MLTYPLMDPIAFHIGTWPVYWYGLMYLIGFLAGWGVLSLRLRHRPDSFTQDQLSDMVFFAALGAIIGGRLGYVFFYDFAAFIQNPLVLFQTWKGGMSFHGGCLGVILGMWIGARKFKQPFLALTDFLSPGVPLGLGAGRIGNFINGELWGRPTTASWGMVFPNADALPRHPSQLYEFGLEGLLLFSILWLFSSKPRPLGAVSGLFAVCYALFRIFVEFFREPDQQIGYLAFGWLTEGQLLSVPLMFIGISLLLYAYTKAPRPKQLTDTL